MEEEAGRVLPPPKGHPRFPLLDSLRALAAISVLTVHVGILSGGFDPWYKQAFAHLDIGVPFFFLLSGFLLYRPMLAARITDLPGQRITSYARNRFFRIAPAYWIVLTVAALVPGFYGAFTGNWWVYFGLLQSFPVYTPEGLCAVSPFECGFPPAWSLSVEILFYIGLPFFSAGMAMLGRLFGLRRWVALEFSVLAILTAASLQIQSSLPFSDLHRWLFFSPIGRGWWFALGLGLAVVSVWASTRPSEPKLVSWIGSHAGFWWLSGGVIYLATALLVLEPNPTLAAPIIESSKYLTSVIAFGLVSLFFLLPAVFRHRDGGVIRRFLEHRLLVYLGLISYGIFLWHFPVIGVLLDLGSQDWAPKLQFPLMMLITFTVTVALASLSFYLVERPLMAWSRRRGQRTKS